MEKASAAGSWVCAFVCGRAQVHSTMRLNHSDLPIPARQFSTVYINNHRM